MAIFSQVQHELNAKHIELQTKPSDRNSNELKITCNFCLKFLDYLLNLYAKIVWKSHDAMQYNKLCSLCEIQKHV